jgi:ribosomal protein RSM22 (predicted rRNA methylase)
MESLFPPLREETRRQIDSLPALVDRAIPLPKRFRSGLPRDVAELSRLLTSGRGDRNESYLGEGPFLSAYLRYFLPWNVYRLARLLPSLSLPLAPGSAITDLGSGPLTFPIALWISRPDLRNVPLEFRCLDRAGPALEAGKKLFAALVSNAAPGASGPCPWTIKTIRASVGDPIRFPKANLVSAINLFNELFWKLPRTDHESLRAFAEKQARLLAALSLESGAILALEPGIPRCGEFLSLLREALAAKGHAPIAPCPHAAPCPLPGVSAAAIAASRAPRADAKWCHFAFETADAPESLHRLSKAAGIPKERAVLSFLLAGPSAAANAAPAVPPAETTLAVRVVSDAFPLSADPARSGPPPYGRYGCSARGLALVSGTRGEVERLESGALARFADKAPERRDGKSGALVVEL